MPWPTYRFDGYTLRLATAAELDLAEQWNAADKYHMYTTKPAYWIEQSQKVNSYVLEDEAGVVFFFRLDRLPNPETLWLNIQFAPGQKRRTVRGLVQGFRWLRKILPLNGVVAVYFTSRSETLLRFADRRLGFRREGNRMVATMPRLSDLTKYKEGAEIYERANPSADKPAKRAGAVLPGGDPERQYDVWRGPAASPAASVDL